MCVQDAEYLVRITGATEHDGGRDHATFVIVPSFHWASFFFPAKR